MNLSISHRTPGASSLPQSGPWPLGADRPGYRICAKTVMDTSDPDIVFDEEGVSNHWHDYQRTAAESLLPEPERTAALDRVVARIRAWGRGRPHDSIVGLSGGVDSSYLALVAVELGLRPLAVHFDNGWNSEQAVKNIESLIGALGLDLETYVMDWEEFRDLQRAYIRASVVDLEIPTDHMIFGALNRIANQHRLPFVLNGCNVVSESIMPRTWNYHKGDLRNLRDIHRRHGTRPLDHLPAYGIWQTAWARARYRRESVNLLDLVDYDPIAVRRILAERVGWRDYGGKHHESIFTRFYQGYVLPVKFGIDKRRAHLSNLICAGLARRDEALEELATPPYDEQLQREDAEYVAKKLGFSLDELESLLRQPNRRHEDYATDAVDRARWRLLTRVLKPASWLRKKIR